MDECHRGLRSRALVGYLRPAGLLVRGGAYAFVWVAVVRLFVVCWPGLVMTFVAGVSHENVGYGDLDGWTLCSRCLL